MIALATILSLSPCRTGAEVLVDRGLAELRGKRVALVTNHTAMVGTRHLIDILHADKRLKLVALFGPEHGLRGLADAGAKVGDTKDEAIGVPVYSLISEMSRASYPLRKTIPNFMKRR